MKKRHQITVTEEVYSAIQADLRELGLPPSAISALIDDWLCKFAPTLRLMADRKRQGAQLTFDQLLGNLFAELGKSLQEE